MSTRIVSTALVVALTAGCGADEPGRVVRDSNLELSVSTIVSGRASTAFPARVVAAENAELSTRATGTVRAIRVEVGSEVSAGEVLIELESGDVVAALEAARAQESLASNTFARIASLAKDGAATAQELDEAEARLRSAEAAVDQAMTQLGYVRITAPFGGIVTARDADPGDLVVPGRTILEISSASGLEIEADLPAARASTIEPGASVSVVDPRTGARAPAFVTRVVPSLDVASHRFRVEAAFADSSPTGWLPGQFARLEIPEPGARTRWVPADAIVRRGQMTGVFVVERDTARLRWIRLGREREGGVELLSGPSADAQVVRRPTPGLTDGSPVASVEIEPWQVGEE